MTALGAAAQDLALVAVDGFYCPSVDMVPTPEPHESLPSEALFADRPHTEQGGFGSGDKQVRCTPLSW